MLVSLSGVGLDDSIHTLIGLSVVDETSSVIV